MKTLKFRFYCNRRKAEDTYYFEWQNDGWHIGHIAISGPCEPNGTPFLYTNFHHDGVSYPSTIGDFLDWLWRQIRDEEVQSNQAQTLLQELADWVSACEHAEPQWPQWNA